MHRTLTLRFALAACGLLSATAALAESQYGFGTGANVTAQARLALSVTVPKLILLRIGSAGAVQDPISWTIGAAIPTTPATAVSGTNNGAANWTGALPTFSATGAAGNTNVGVSAFTNTTGATLQCAAPTWVPATGGPANAQIGVTTGAGLVHPGGASLATCGTLPTAIAPGAVRTATWTYNLNSTAAQIAAFTAGTYQATLTYTATAP